MPGMVKAGLTSLLFLLLLLGFAPAFGAGSDLKILNAYSLGDKVAFLVINGTSGGLYGVVYNGSSFEAEGLNFTPTIFLVRHWNGSGWLLQRGETVTVGLYTYHEGRLRHVETFRGGSACTDNDLDVKWNGREYLLTFVKGSPEGDLATGECRFISKDYILRGRNLVPLNVSGQEVWVPALNAWLIGCYHLGYLFDENGRLLGEYNFSRTGIYSLGLVIDGDKNLITVTADRGWVKVFAAGNRSLVLTYRGRFGERALGEGPYPPVLWVGKPVLFDIGSYNSTESSVWLFNGTDFVRAGELGNAMLYSVTLPGWKRSYILSSTPMKTYTLLGLFEVRNTSLVRIGSLKVENAYLKVVRAWPRGFPAQEVSPGNMLVAPGENSVFLFNSAHMVDLISGRTFSLPHALKEHEYGVTFCRGGVFLFSENKVYLFKNGEFRDVTLEILSALSSLEKNKTAPSLHENREERTAVLLSPIAVMVVIVGLVFLWRGRRYR
ncbi:hypothetical protein [Thermococcus sp.]|uniref:hypothetical protein n=1 Tax=Thermococcus sp. TaxID=35749 RepID=UPI002603598D|nr:hypothetical protein [Thermococcus sp.]